MEAATEIKKKNGIAQVNYNCFKSASICISESILEEAKGAVSGESDIITLVSSGSPFFSSRCVIYNTSLV
jgi:hypothetical protein